MQSYRASRRLFRGDSPAAALGMGGFTSAPPLLAARGCGAAIFLHESNAVPGRANRWLSWVVDHSFVGFPHTKDRLHGRRVTVTGTPVRSEFTLRPASSARLELGLHPDRPVVLIVGGSQGARGLNDAVLDALPSLANSHPGTQWIHLTGPHDVEKVRSAYAAVRLSAIVLPFLDAMDLALSSASVVVSRAGASCLAELSAMRTPSLLVPFPAAADNHQWHNAHQFEQTGAARLLEQRLATPETLGRMISEFLDEPTSCDRARAALAGWHRPHAAAEIAELILQRIAEHVRKVGSATHSIQPSGDIRHSSVIA